MIEVKIKQGEKMIDATIEMVNGVMVVSPKVEKFEPKDGDVVYSGGFYEFVFIYKDNLTSEAYYYVSLHLKDNKIELPDGGHIGYVSHLRPATEEEKKLLFDKLKEEGLEFDFDKKELVKLKWKPKIGEAYYRPDFLHCRFICYSGTFDYCKMNFIKDHINKGWVFKTEEECEEFCCKLNDAINQIKP